MARALNASYIEEKNKLEGTFPLKLFEIEYGDLSASRLYYAACNKDIDYYKPNTSTAQTYTRAPIDIGNISYSYIQESPRINITLSNVDRTITDLLLDYDGLRGRPITIVKVFEKLLSNPNACVVEKYYVDSVSIDKNNAQFTLVPKTIVDGVTIPRRVYRRNQCQWKFKSTECGYTGAETTCQKTLASCEQYNNVSRYGGFPGIPRRRVYF